jgi:hypothetical protein
MCWRSDATTFGDARHILVTCIAIGCYRVTNIWLALYVTRPAWNPINVWRAQEIKKHPLHNLQILPETYSCFTHPENGCIKILRNVSNYLPTKFTVRYDVRRLTGAPNTNTVVTSKCPKWRFASEKYRVWTNRSYIKVAETAELQVDTGTWNCLQYTADKDTSCTDTNLWCLLPITHGRCDNTTDKHTDRQTTTLKRWDRSA